MRAPGECPGTFGIEVAMDELAVACGVDPVELRILNDPEVEPESGKPWSSRNLVACLRLGGRQFGLRVVFHELDLFTQQTALGVDFFRRQLQALRFDVAIKLQGAGEIQQHPGLERVGRQAGRRKPEPAHQRTRGTAQAVAQELSPAYLHVVPHKSDCFTLPCVHRCVLKQSAAAKNMPKAVSNR